MRRVKESLIYNARSLRAEMTDAEKKLWQSIRQIQLGVRFRRQHPIERFIADFACLDPKVVIEIDGGQHAENVSRDEDRTMVIESHGFKVLRFWNNEVLQNLEGVLQVIAQKLAPHPHPPSQGAPAAASAGRFAGATHASRNPRYTLPPQKGKGQSVPGDE